MCCFDLCDDKHVVDADAEEEEGHDGVRRRVGEPEDGAHAVAGGRSRWNGGRRRRSGMEGGGEGGEEEEEEKVENLSERSARF